MIIMKIDENFILYELTDEELEQMTDDEILEFGRFCEKNGINEAMTVKGLLKKDGLKYGDLSKFAQDYYVGVCNSATRTDTQVYISRKGSPIKDNIVINLNPNRDVPYLTHQIQVNDDFLHEEGYSEEGFELYRS